MKEKLIICPRCSGAGETPLERRRVRIGMNVFWEYGCTCCRASGRTTRSQWLQWQANRQHPAQPGYLAKGQR